MYLCSFATNAKTPKLSRYLGSFTSSRVVQRNSLSLMISFSVNSPNSITPCYYKDQAKNGKQNQSHDQISSLPSMASASHFLQKPNQFRRKQVGCAEGAAVGADEPGADVGTTGADVMECHGVVVLGSSWHPQNLPGVLQVVAVVDVVSSS